MESSKLFKRKMLLWTSSWSQEEPPSSEEVPFTPNATEIASLLQAVGFHVRHMDRCLPTQMHPVPGVPADYPACRVILMCPKSGIRMELDAQTSTCSCPPPGDPGLPLGQNWMIDEREGQETLRAVVDSVVQRPSSDVAGAMSQLIAGMFHVLSLLPDQNHNNTSRIAIPATSGSLMKTPATGIAVVTPNAPCVPKVSEESKAGIPGRYRSLDTLIASGGLADDLPEPGQLTPKDEGDSVPPAMAMEIDGADLDSTMTQAPGSEKKKFFSKSSPAINCTEQFQRSSTFVFEDNEGVVDGDPATIKGKPKRSPLLRSDTFITEALVTNPEDQPGVGPPPRRTPSPGVQVPSVSQASVLLSKLQDVQQSVSDLIFMVAGNEKNLSNIGDVSKASKAVAGALQRITDGGVRPIRCLSDFGSVPNLSRTGSTTRSISRLNSRRHGPAIAAATTPRTSRRSAIPELPKRTSAAGTPGAKSLISRHSTSRLSVPAPGSGLRKTSTSPTSSTVIASVTSVRDKDYGFDKRQSISQSHIPKPGSIRK